MSMCNLIEYSDICLKTSGRLWQYYRDELALDNNIIDVPSKKISILFKKKQRHKKC